MSGNSRVVMCGVLFLGLLCNSAAQTGANVAAADKGRRAALDADSHLVAWWRFDETSGKSAVDASGHGHDATLEGGLAFDTHSAPGRIGNALKLEGKDAAVRAIGFKGITGTGPRTIAAWIKTPAAAGEIVSWGADDHGKMWTVGHIRGRIGVTPKGGYLYMKARTDDDAWHHVAVVVQEASPPNLHDDVKLFRNGQPAEIDDIGLLDLWPIETGAELDLRIGLRFKGLIDDLRLYDRALTEDEVGALFKTENSPPSGKP